MIDHREVLRLLKKGMYQNQIAASMGVGRKAVHDAKLRLEAAGLTWEQAQGMTTAEVNALVKAQDDGDAHESPYMMPDWDKIHREATKSHVTLQRLWEEYCAECTAAGKLFYKTSRFYELYTAYCKSKDVHYTVRHIAGNIMEVDWAGDTLRYTDDALGAQVKVFVFLATLPYSQYSYVEAFPDMKLASWIQGHVDAFNYFGGVPRLVTPDNLKTGVTTNTRDELVLNKSYQEMAEHYEIGILPARPRKPRDKASVEGSVQIVYHRIYAALRNREFFSLAELNQAIRTELTEYNRKPFQSREGSRLSVFLEEEKPLLRPLPVAPYEAAVWSTARVPRDYHICVDKRYYSVPYVYAQMSVDVRTTTKTIEVFHKGERIAAHIRRYGGTQREYHTIPDHMPPSHQAYAQRNSEGFVSQAQKYGPYTAQAIQSYINGFAHEAQAYKGCGTILRLADKAGYSGAMLEAACKMAIDESYHVTPKLIMQLLDGPITAAAQHNPDPAPNPVTSEHDLTRGASYYGGEI